MTPSTPPDPLTRPVRLAGLKGADFAFDLRPDAEARAALAAEYDLLDLRKLSFGGVLRPHGSRDWELQATLGATVVQPCGVTLAPVTTRIDEPVTRRFVADLPEVSGSEVEMPEDDTLEPLGATVDLARIMAEALALALPPFPRAKGVDPVRQVFAEPGKTPMSDNDARPFASLAELRDKLKKPSEEG